MHTYYGPRCELIGSLEAMCKHWALVFDERRLFSGGLDWRGVSFIAADEGDSRLQLEFISENLLHRQMFGVAAVRGSERKTCRSLGV